MGAHLAAYRLHREGYTPDGIANELGIEVRSAKRSLNRRGVRFSDARPWTDEDVTTLRRLMTEHPDDYMGRACVALQRTYRSVAAKAHRLRHALISP